MPDTGSTEPDQRPDEDEASVERAVGEQVQRSGPPASGLHGTGEAAPHAAALLGSDDEVLAVAVPFVEHGLRAGDLVALNCRPEHAELIRGATGERLRHVPDDPALSLLGNRAPDALATCERYLAEAVGSRNGRLRVLSSIDFGDDPADWREGQRFESVSNRFLPSTVSVLCMYDRRLVPAPVSAGAAATHPVLVSGTGRVASARFQDPAVFLPALPRPRDPAEDGAPLLVVDRASRLTALRQAIGHALERVVADRDLREDLHLGASEIAANAFRHGVPPVSARVWADDRTVVVSISDHGSFDDPFTGFAPAHGRDLGRGGMGMWLARKLYDHVDLLPEPDGVTVRLSTRLR